MWHDDHVSGDDPSPSAPERARTAVYTAWNGREYPWPPPAGWELRSDRRYWPIVSDADPSAGPGGFVPTYGPTPMATYARPDALPAPRTIDRVGSLPLRRRSIIIGMLGVLLLLASLQFLSVDILGFTVEQQDFAGLDHPQAGPEFAPVDEERELSPATIDELIEIDTCTGTGGARAEGQVHNPLDGERAYLITVEFFVDGARQLDGFAEVSVPPGETETFSAVTASPSVDGTVTCSAGSVFRFIPE